MATLSLSCGSCVVEQRPDEVIIRRPNLNELELSRPIKNGLQVSLIFNYAVQDPPTLWQYARLYFGERIAANIVQAQLKMGPNTTEWGDIAVPDGQEYFQFTGFVDPAVAGLPIAVQVRVNLIAQNSVLRLTHLQLRVNL
jgi:hypothetical protein